MDEGDVIEVDDKNWEEIVEKQDKPVVVMFYLTTCQHCKVIEPYFRQFAREFKDSCKFLKINALDNQWTAGRYGIMATPTFKFLCKGLPAKEEVGAVQPGALRRSIESFIEHGEECILKSTSVDYDISPYE
jgi:thioredoxin 1